MAWIKTFSEADASGELADAYAGIRRGFPVVPNVMQAFSLKPKLVRGVAGLAQAATFGASSLTRVQEEMIATVVSSINRCHY